MRPSTLKLGTRRSLLAWAQSSQVAREIERLNPGVAVELIGIETRGDKILDISLREVVGKEFFVAELDEALASGEVDVSVHSMKDLSLDRPAGFTIGAIPRRVNLRDVIVFGPGVMDKISNGLRLRIGTSSPRRLENVKTFLDRVLPQSPPIDWVEIRGNVNTRLERVHLPQGSPRALDGVVLAFAGLIRLWEDERGRQALSELLLGVKWMVLPLRECPAAPAQGALAVECRADDPATKSILSPLHDPKTALEVARERKILSDWGGGCHQRFGASCVSVDPHFKELLWIRGKKPDDSFVEELRWDAPPDLPRGEAWDGLFWREKEASQIPQGRCAFSQGSNVFVAHSRAVTKENARLLHDLGEARIWTSGVASWERLARLGLWVEGCAEGLGFEFLKPTLNEPVLGLHPSLEQWWVLTHEAAAEDWKPWGSHTIATYRVESRYPPEAIDRLKTASEVFWASGSQQDALKDWVGGGARQACGPGKTVQRLKEQGIEPLVFPSVLEWRKWIKTVSVSR